MKDPAPLNNIPNKVAEIVGRTLQKEKQKRYQTMKSLLTDLQEFKREYELQSRLAKSSVSQIEEPRTQIFSLTVKFYQSKRPTERHRQKSAKSFTAKPSLITFTC